ncbi:MAG: hypothetical protein HGA23_06365, partial [Bacteroidales bacterium]|nr:hypothetical protein [Bacteroidales bacterium]
LLVENQGHLLLKEELLRRVWPDAIVEENNLTVTISALRKALGEGPTARQYIETVPRRGYRFVAADDGHAGVEAASAAPAATAATAGPALAVPSGNLPVHPSGVFFRNTLVMLMEAAYGAKFYPVHRLDRETSGAILFGRSAGAASLIQRDFRNFSRSYLAVVRGVPDRSEFTVDMPIGPAAGSLIRKKREAYEGAPEEARTDFRVVSSADGFSLLEAFPVTGRMHQIRVHLKYAGLPIAGDKLYGEDETVYLDYVNSGPTGSVIERAGFSRCALHSRTIEFIHPYTGAEIFIGQPDGAIEKGIITVRPGDNG